jgi:hypothetical protein
MRPESEADIDWEATTREGCRRRQLEHWAQLSLDDIFAAQEEMAEFARQVGSRLRTVAMLARDHLRPEVT